MMDKRLHPSHQWDYDPMYRCVPPECLGCGITGESPQAKSQCVPDGKVRTPIEEEYRKTWKEVMRAEP